MVENRGSCEKTVWRAGCAEGPESYYNTDGRPFCYDTPRATEPFDGEKGKLLYVHDHSGGFFPRRTLWPVIVIAEPAAAGCRSL